MEIGIFTPGINFLNKFKYPTKISIIIAVLVLFTGWLFYLIINKLDKHIEFTKKEIIGLEYIDPVKNLLEDFQESRNLTDEYLQKKNLLLKDEILKKNKEIEDEINLINIVRKKNNNVLKIDKIWNQINNEWKNLKNNSLNLTPEENFKKHTDLIDKTIYLITYFGDTSGLILDSQLDTFYLGRSISRNIPELTEGLSQAKNLGIKITERKKILNNNEKIAFVVQSIFAKEDLHRLNKDFLTLFNSSKFLKKKLENFYNEVNTSTNYFINLINKEIIETNKIKISSKFYSLAGTSAIKSTYRLYEAEIHTLDELLDGRIKKYEQEKIMLTSSVLIVFLLLFYLLVSFSYALINSLKTLEKTALSVSKGNFDVEAEIYSKKDEMGSLSISFNSMIKNLKMLMERETLLRKIIIETRKFEDHDGMYNYLLEQLADLFGVNRCLHLHYDEKNNLFVKNEFLKDKTLKSLLGQTILSSEYTEEMSPENPLQVYFINDVNKEIFSPELKKYLKNNSIQSYLIYSTVRICPSETKRSEILGFTLICFPTPKGYTSDEKEFFRLIVDAVSIIFLEFKQRQETEEIKRNFIATLTHDLRSPILAEQKALEMMISRKVSCFDDACKEYLDDIYKTNEGLLKLVNNLLSVYHYESGFSILSRTQTGINEIIEESVRALKYLAEDKESKINYEIQEDLPLVNIDSEEISRVLINLIGNAIKHTKKGTQININAFKTDDSIEISIRDNGEGISEENIPLIFQRYPTEKSKVGTGLGLYLSKQIVEAHEGKIWFETKEGEGTTFHFTLPV